MITKAQADLLTAVGQRQILTGRLNALEVRESRTDVETREFEQLQVEDRASTAAMTTMQAVVDAEQKAGEVVTPTGDSESRERIELRAKTGIADFLRAAAGGQGVSGAAAEYAASVGVPTVGHLPMELFGRTTTTLETRAITAAPAVDGPLQATVPFVFERSAAASLGITDAHFFRWGEHTYRISKVDGIVKDEVTGTRFFSEVFVLR